MDLAPSDLELHIVNARIIESDPVSGDWGIGEAVIVIKTTGESLDVGVTEYYTDPYVAFDEDIGWGKFAGDGWYDNDSPLNSIAQSGGLIFD